MGFGTVGGGQVGDDDAGAVRFNVAHAEFKQEAGARLGNHGNHGIVAEMVAGIDVRGAYRQLRGIAVLVFGKFKFQTGHGVLLG